MFTDKLELHAREISEIVNDTKDLLLILSNGLRLSLVMLKRKSCSCYHKSSCVPLIKWRAVSHSAPQCCQLSISVFQSY